MKLLARTSPRPLQSGAILLTWILLNNSVAPGILLLGVLLAWLLPLATAPMLADQPRRLKPRAALSLLGRLFKDILYANFEVARRVLGPRRRLQPALVAVPLSLESNLERTLLANMVSLTPGTLSTEVSADQRWLYLHVLHLEDEAALVEEIKARYEAPLKEIFAC